MQKQHNHRKNPFSRPSNIKSAMNASSSKDCTGLIPSGGDPDEEEFESYEEIYPFTVPKMPDKHGDKKDIRDAERFNRF